MNYNKVIFAGYICNDVKMNHTKDGTKVLNLTVAVNERRDKEKRPIYLNVILWTGLAEYVCENFSKGSNIFVEGHLQAKTIKEGEKLKSTFDVIAENVASSPEVKA